MKTNEQQRDLFPSRAVAGVCAVGRGAGSLSQRRGVGSQGGGATAQAKSETERSFPFTSLSLCQTCTLLDQSDGS